MADQPKIDRQTTTPFLLRLFYRKDNYHRTEEFAPSGPLPQHVQIYTWPTCSLRELSHLLLTALPSILPSPSVGTRLCFRLIYPDTQARYGPARFLSKDLGTIVIGPDASSSQPISERLEGDMDKTLRDARFVIGDYVAVAVLPPGANGEVAPPPVARAGRGGRENGYGGGYGGYGRGRRYEERGRLDRPFMPSGEWRRGELPPMGGGGHGIGYERRGRGRGRGGW